MIRANPHRLYILLITASLLLLSGFVGYWLYKSYEEQENLLRREAAHLYGSAIKKSQDSLLRLHVLQQLNENLTEDSVQQRRQFQVFRYESDVPRMLMERTDSMRMQRDTGGIRQVELFLRTNQSRSPGTSRLAPEDAEHVRVTFRGLRGDNPFSMEFGEDSSQIDRIEAAFAKNLSEAGLPLSFRLIHRDEARKMEDQPFPGIVVLRYKRNEQYFYPYPFLAHLPDVRRYLMRQMWPQMAFSLLLLLLTATAFVLIYRSWRKQQRLAILKNDFISNITHELKTPITTVGVALEAMSNFNALGNPAKTAEYLDISKNELNRLSILVDKVLKMSIFESREPQINPEPIDLKALCQEIIQTMSLHLEQQQARIALVTSDDTFQVEADRVHLTNVIYNLIDNAIKYSEGKAWVQLSLKANLHQVFLSVSDRGIGIPDQYHAKVFDKFFRVPTGDQHNRKGHGLGLSYVASVIDKHGGKIRVDSRLDQGSTFTITLNRTYAADQDPVR